MRITNKKKFIARILDLIVIVLTLAFTPKAIAYATELRGYKAYGGEYLLPLLGLVIVMVIETIYEESEKNKHGKHRK